MNRDIMEILKSFMSDEAIERLEKECRKEKEDNAEIDYLANIAHSVAAVNKTRFECDYKTRKVVVYLPNELDFAEETFLKIKKVKAKKIGNYYEACSPSGFSGFFKYELSLIKG